MSTFDTQANQISIPLLIIGGIGVTIGLAWNNAISALIDNYIPQDYANSKNAWVKVVYAVILTIIISIAIYIYQCTIEK
jgi:uncharacterized membrane protein YdbT with pleckstrin-like domain